jgi:acyl dehydratase
VKAGAYFRYVAVVPDDLMRHDVTDDGIARMRHRSGYPNPTVRSGTRQLAWWTVTTPDAIRHFTNGYGDDNPLFVDPDYAAGTRWGALVAPPGFVAEGGPHAHRAPPPEPVGDADEVPERGEAEAWLRRLGRRIPDELHRETRSALRGIQLYNSGNDTHYYEPFFVGDYVDGSAGGVHQVVAKESEFSGRSALVTNRVVSWNQRGAVTTVNDTSFVHAARRRADAANKYSGDEPAQYTDDELAAIEAAYDAEFRRGADTLFWEDVDAGTELPTMVKGPMVVTDLVNHHMGWGWGPYGNGALRLGYENRKRMPGFYSRNTANAWDVIQRVHWDPELAREIGVPMAYDIGPMRRAWAVHYLTNFMGDDAWLFHLHTEWRRFNYFGDTTWWNGSVTAKRLDDDLGPLIDVAFTGTNQRGLVNSVATATILLASREHGQVKLPPPPRALTDRVVVLRDEHARRRGDGGAG